VSADCVVGGESDFYASVFEKDRDESKKRRYDIQKWEMMAGDRKHRDGTDGRRYDKQRWELMASDTK